MLHNFGFVSKSQEFLELSTETVVKLLSEDKLKSVSEEQVCGYYHTISGEARSRDCLFFYDWVPIMNNRFGHVTADFAMIGYLSSTITTRNI